MTITPLSDLEQQLNTISAALTAYRDQIQVLADRANANRLYSMATSYHSAVALLAPVFAALENRPVALPTDYERLNMSSAICAEQRRGRPLDNADLLNCGNAGCVLAAGHDGPHQLRRD